MNKRDIYALTKVSLFHINEFWRLHDPNDSWANLKEKQVHRDALEALKQYKLIDDYDFKNGVCIKGDWRFK